MILGISSVTYFKCTELSTLIINIIDHQKAAKSRATKVCEMY